MQIFVDLYACLRIYKSTNKLLYTSEFKSVNQFIKVCCLVYICAYAHLFVHTSLCDCSCPKEYVIQRVAFPIYISLHLCKYSLGYMCIYVFTVYVCSHLHVFTVCDSVCAFICLNIDMSIYKSLSTSIIYFVFLIYMCLCVCYSTYSFTCLINLSINLSFHS